MQNLLQDLRFAVRMLLKRPGFTVVAVVTLALGIGANTAIFSVVNGVLLRPLPFQNPAELAMVWLNYQGRGGPDREWLSPSDFEDWRAQNTTFSHLSALNDWGPTLTGLAEPEPLVGARVSHDLFTLLGREPVMGRSFRPEEDQVGAPKVVMLSNALWQRRFGSDRDIIGKSISPDQESYTVVGVMPAGFKFPVIANTELRRPLRPTINPSCQRGCLTLRAIARLKSGVSLVTAAADLTTIGMMLAVIGAAIGVAGALALTRLMSTLLFGVTPKDASTFIGLSLGLLAVALIACYLPARRATKVDPLVALRYE